MKRIIGIFSLVFVVIAYLSAYNYQTVYSNRTALYSDSNNGMRGMRIDSVSMSGQDSVFIPLKNIQKTDVNCYTPHGASWLGYQIKINEDGCIFSNRHGDQIWIKSSAKTGEIWRVLNAGGIYVDAIVEKTELLTFMGITDSVKTISFDAKIAICTCAPKRVIESIVEGFDNKTIQISKHYGMLKTINFYDFPYPDQNSMTYTSTWEQFKLVGLTNPIIGVQNLKWFDVFDFQPGDEIHNKYSYYATQAGPPTYNRSYTIIKYISRINYSDSIVYQTERTERDSAFTGTINTDATYFHGFEKKIIMKVKYFDLLPGESYISQYAIGTNVMIDSIIIYKSDPVEINYNKNLKCWSIIPDYYEDGYSTGYSKYLKGLGGPYFKSESIGLDLSSSEAENKLVYYKKGSTTWGVPLVISGINKPKIESKITVLPNPATDKITVNNLNESCTLELLDLKGSVMLHTSLNALENTVGLSRYDKGLYLYRISGNGELLKAGKIVKQ